MASKMYADMVISKGGDAKTVDFAAFKAKIETPDLVDAIQAIYDKELAGTDLQTAMDAQTAENQAFLKGIFDGDSGLVRTRAQTGGLN